MKKKSNSHKADETTKQKLLPHSDYVFISRRLWGAVPIDEQWAIDTNIFKENYKEILKERNR